MSDPVLTDADWQALYLRLERPLFNLAWRYTWASAEAQDVVHDAFIRLWSKRASLRAETVDRYLWKSVLNLARNRRRWKKLRNYFEIDEEVIAGELETHDVESGVIRVEEEARLHSAIEALPEKLREVLLLTEFSELKYEEIASLLNVPAGTVASRRHLAIARLRNALAPKELR